MVLHAGWPANPQLLEAPPFPKLGVRTKGPTLYPSFVLLLDATLPAHTRAADSPAGRSEALELLRGTGAQPTTKLHYETANWARRTCVSPLSGLSAAYVCCHLPAAAAPPRPRPTARCSYRIVYPTADHIDRFGFHGDGVDLWKSVGVVSCTPLSHRRGHTRVMTVHTLHTSPLSPVLFLKVLAGDRLAWQTMLRDARASFPVVSCLLPSSQACDALERRHLPSLSFVGHRLDERMANKWDQSEKENGPAVRRACTTPHKPEHPPAHPAEARRVLLLEQHPT